MKVRDGRVAPLIKLQTKERTRMIVSQILQNKGHEVWSVSPDDTVYDALSLMASMNVGALLVLSEGEIAGIFSERDYARKVVLQGKSSKKTPVNDVMTTAVVCVNADQNLETCMALMTEKHIRHLPVLTESGELTGLISIGDVVKAVISEQEHLINHLEGYITGRA
ncbi:MAG: CBS domain-containing protein [Anaerolineae bacterium]